MQVIHIYPLGNLCFEYRQNMHMFLTHLVEKYPMYAKLASKVPGYKILDNSLIELGDAVNLDRVLNAADIIKADEIILPDVFQKGPETIEAVKQAVQDIHNKYPNNNCPYKLMAVAQGRTPSEWLQCYDTLLEFPEIDVIGIPKVLAKMHPGGRPYMVNNFCDLDKKPHHLLGLWYSFIEFGEYKDLKKIRSCDTVLGSYISKHHLGINGVRPDGYTIDLEMDIVEPHYVDLGDIYDI